MSKRPYGEGSIDQRGKELWRLRYRIDGTAFTTYVRGSISDARKELRRVLKSGDDGEHVPANKITVAQWIEGWLAGLQVGPRTAERYGQLMRRHVIPHVGSLRLQKLTSDDIDGCYAKLTGISPRTRRHVHVVLGTCMRKAVKKRMIVRNPILSADAPAVPEEEIGKALGRDELAKLMAGFVGHALYPVVATAIGTGARRNELLALRWADVDLQGKTVRIARAIEKTKAHGKRLKSPKTKAGTRAITVDDGLVGLLRSERDKHLRLAAGIPDGAKASLTLVKLPDGALVFPAPGEALDTLRDADAVTRTFQRKAKALGFPELRLHDLRHTHGSRLIAAGLPITAVAARLGHTPEVLLRCYAHEVRDAENGKLAADVVASLAVLPAT